MPTGSVCPLAVLQARQGNILLLQVDKGIPRVYFPTQRCNTHNTNSHTERWTCALLRGYEPASGTKPARTEVFSFPNSIFVITNKCRLRDSLLPDSVCTVIPGRDSEISLRLSEATPQVSISPKNPSWRDGGICLLSFIPTGWIAGWRCNPVVSLHSTTG